MRSLRHFLDRERRLVWSPVDLYNVRAARSDIDLLFRLLSWLWFLPLLRSDDRAKYLEIERATFRGIRNLFSISNKTVDERIGPIIEALKQAELLSR